MKRTTKDTKGSETRAFREVSCLSWFFPLLALSWIVSPALADQNLETARRRNGDAVVAAFTDAQASIQRSSAVIQEGRRRLAYGVVVSPDGWILTKASEVQSAGTLNVIVDAETFADVRVAAVDPIWDVALLKVTAENLTPVAFASGEPPQGAWVVANGATSRAKRRVLPGIVSANAREIPASGGAALGVVLKEGGKSLAIAEVSEKSGAHEAGLQPGDVIVAVEGKKVSKPAELRDQLKDRKAGSAVKLKIRRDGKELAVEVRLMARGEMADEQSRNDQMSGDFSPRRTGFPRVIQHDILGARDSVGGPLVDLDGKCVGMNIARADRAQSFAIPAKEVQEITARLMKSKNE